MTKKNNATESKNLNQLMAELNEVATKHNMATSAGDKIKLKAEAEKLQKDYNEVAKVDAYNECLKAENPMLTFIKRYTYNVVKVSTDKKTDVMAVKTENPNGTKITELFDLWDFVAFCEGKNKQVTAALDWKTKALKAQNDLIENITKYIEQGLEKDVKALKEALQGMFDSIVMVPGAKGNNAIKATSKQARIIYMTAGRLNAKKVEAMFAQENSWHKQAFAFLHVAVEGKEFICTYGDNAPGAETTTETTEE